MLLIGDDWAKDHHDLELEDEDGHRPARTRLTEGLEGITRLHALVAEHAPAGWADLPPEQAAGQVIIGIETGRGPWVTALRAAGYLVFAINPLWAPTPRRHDRTQTRHQHLRPDPGRQRVAIFYTKVHDHLLRPLIAADKPPAPVELRRAPANINQAVHHYADKAGFATAAGKLKQYATVLNPKFF